VKKTLIITLATVVSIALASTAALFALNAAAGSHQTCGKVNPAELRAAADPNYAKTLESSPAAAADRKRSTSAVIRNR
jgi:hypothetical protein